MHPRRVILALTAAACTGGGGGGSGSDAPAMTADGTTAPGAVEVTVYTNTGDGALDTSAFAIFYDLSGAVVADGTVDANGQAHCDVAPGSSITVLQIVADPADRAIVTDRLTTIRGIAPGDHLIAGRTRDPSYRGGGTDVMTASYVAPDPSSGPALLAACPDVAGGNVGAPMSLTFHTSCVTPTFDLLAVDAGSFVWLPDLQHVPGGSIAIPNTWQPLAHTTTAIGNVPSEVRLATQLHAVIGGTPFELDAQSIEAPVPASTTIALGFAPIAAPTRLEAFLAQGTQVLQRHVVVATGSPATLAIDLAEQPLPIPTRPMQSATGLAWSESGAGAPDARVITWTSTWIDENQIMHTAEWEIFEDPQPSTSTVLPGLPAAYADDDPTVVDPLRTGSLRGAAVFYLDYDNLAGYAAARAVANTIVDPESAFLTVDHRAHSTMASTN